MCPCMTRTVMCTIDGVFACVACMHGVTEKSQKKSGGTSRFPATAGLYAQSRLYEEILCVLRSHTTLKSLNIYYSLFSVYAQQTITVETANMRTFLHGCVRL